MVKQANIPNNLNTPFYYENAYFMPKLLIKIHDSESRGQVEAGHTRRMSVLFTASTAVKFVNALNKPPLKLSLSYQRLSTF